MSYASVAAHNAPPPSEQPQPDPALLNTTAPSHSVVADDAAKVNVVAPDFKQDPHTYTSEADRMFEEEEILSSPGLPRDPSGPAKREKSNRRIQEVQAEGLYIWETLKHHIIRPGVAGGLIGLVNIGLLASVGRIFYTRPHLHRDATAISSTVVAAVALLSAEGYAAEKYRQTPRGREEERRAKEEGAAIFRHLHNQIMRPGVLGGMVGLVNAALLGSLGYISYQNWNRPWDRKVVSAISVGLLTLWGGEGVIAERYVHSSRK